MSLLIRDHSPRACFYWQPLRKEGIGMATEPPSGLLEVLIGTFQAIFKQYNSALIAQALWVYLGMCKKLVKRVEDSVFAAMGKQLPKLPFWCALMKFYFHFRDLHGGRRHCLPGKGIHSHNSHLEELAVMIGSSSLTKSFPAVVWSVPPKQCF